MKGSICRLKLLHDIYIHSSFLFSIFSNILRVTVTKLRFGMIGLDFLTDTGKKMQYITDVKKQ